MKIIKCLVENIRDEMEDAEKYAKLAMEHKDDYPDLSDTFVTLSEQEVNHANLLHMHVERFIRDYRAKKGEPPAPMMAVYDWEHQKMIDTMARVRVLQDMARGK